MLLGEPPRSGGDLNFQLFGIPVRVHPFFWLIAGMLGLGANSQLIDLLIWLVAVFLSVLIHELGHALAMRSFGIWPWITLYSFGGLTSYSPAEARRVGSLGQILISFAGPAAPFLLVAVIVAVLLATGHTVVVGHGGLVPMVVPGEPVVSPGFTLFIFDLMFVSIAWGILNLMPVYPLDGGHIAREIFVLISPRNGIVRSLWLSTGVAILLVIVAFPSIFLMLLFGFMAYGNYQTLQAYQNQRGW